MLIAGTTVFNERKNYTFTNILPIDSFTGSTDVYGNGFTSEETATLTGTFTEGNKYVLVFWSYSSAFDLKIGAREAVSYYFDESRYSVYGALVEVFSIENTETSQISVTVTPTGAGRVLYPMIFNVTEVYNDNPWLESASKETLTQIFGSLAYFENTLTTSSELKNLIYSKGDLVPYYSLEGSITVTEDNLAQLTSSDGAKFLDTPGLFKDFSLYDSFIGSKVQGVVTVRRGGVLIERFFTGGTTTAGGGGGEGDYSRWFSTEPHITAQDQLEIKITWKGEEEYASFSDCTRIEVGDVITSYLVFVPNSWTTNNCFYGTEFRKTDESSYQLLLGEDTPSWSYDSSFNSPTCYLVQAEDLIANSVNYVYMRAELSTTSQADISSGSSSSYGVNLPITTAFNDELAFGESLTNNNQISLTLTTYSYIIKTRLLGDSEYHQLAVLSFDNNNYYDATITMKDPIALDLSASGVLFLLLLENQGSLEKTLEILDKTPFSKETTSIPDSRESYGGLIEREGYVSFEGKTVKATEFIEPDGIKAFGLEAEYPNTVDTPDTVAFRILPGGLAVSDSFSEDETMTKISVRKTSSTSSSGVAIVGKAKVGVSVVG